MDMMKRHMAKNVLCIALMFYGMIFCCCKNCVYTFCFNWDSCVVSALVFIVFYFELLQCNLFFFLLSFDDCNSCNFQEDFYFCLNVMFITNTQQ